MEAVAIIHFTNYPKGQSRGCMAAVMRYTAREDKTAWEGHQLVSGFNCRPESVYDDFLRTKLFYHKDGGTMFYHMVQSFPAGKQVDPVTAHATALKLAEYFEGREVLVCTHTDRDHIHSHLIINSVSLEDGKKLHMGSSELTALRKRNDQVCEEFGLPVFQSEPGAKAKPMSDAEYRSAAKDESWKFQTMNAIDRCMRQSATREEFIHKMEQLGYRVRWEPGRQNITYTHPNGKKVRDRKLHEEKYLKEKMEREFYIRQQIIVGGIEAAQYATGDSSSTERVPSGTARSTEGNTSHGGGVDRTAGDDQRDVSFDLGAVQLAQESRLQTDGFYAEGADTGGERYGGDPAADGAGVPEEKTGWEEERAALLVSTAGAQAPSPILGMDLPSSGLGRVVGAVVQLGCSLEHNQSPVYLTHPHSDQKTLRREREKKIAMGHKPDDHEEQQSPNLSM